MKLRRKTHKLLEKFCRTACTRDLGWTRQRREDCRNNTMCRDCKDLVDTANDNAQ